MKGIVNVLCDKECCKWYLNGHCDNDAIEIRDRECMDYQKELDDNYSLVT